MTERFVFLLKTYRNDIEYAIRLIKSYIAHNVDGLKLYVVFPESDKDIFERRCSDENLELERLFVHFLTEESICKYLIDEPIGGISAGYINQEIVKISFWETGICDNYMCLDSDAVIIKDFYEKDFMYDDTYPYQVLYEDNDLKSDPIYYSMYWRPREEALYRIKKEIGLNDRKIITCHGFQIFNKEVLNSFKSDFMIPRGYSYKDLLSISPYEFSWYNFWLQKSNIIPIHTCGEFFKCFHTPQAYVFSRLQGNTQKTLARSYIGFIANSNWARSVDDVGNISKIDILIPSDFLWYIMKQVFLSLKYNCKQRLKKLFINN